MRLTTLLISLTLLITRCTSAGNTERVLATQYFKILYTSLDDKNIMEIADSLENSYPK